MRSHQTLVLLATTAAAFECLEAGFTPALRCGSCATLEALVPDAEVAEDCRRCCTEDNSLSTFAAARLEVCE